MCIASGRYCYLVAGILLLYIIQCTGGILTSELGEDYDLGGDYEGQGNETDQGEIVDINRHGKRVYPRKIVFYKKIFVDQSGKGHYKTVQAAIDSIPVNNRQWVSVQINAGIYREKVTVPYNKPRVMIQGAGRKTTIITWNEVAGGRHGTADSATFSSFAPGFIARGVGFRNGAPKAPPGTVGKQAVAALLAGDKAAFYDCGFYGAQDTLFDYQGRHYFKNCYIEGSIDFIFGHGRSTYKKCELYAIAERGYLSGSITAQNRASLRDQSGFVFIACKITGTGRVFLGRAWGPYSRVIFAYTYMAKIIVPQGWDDWGLVQRHRTVDYGEYKCYGPGAKTHHRVKWSKDLTHAQVRPYLSLAFINGAKWLTEF